VPRDALNAKAVVVEEGLEGAVLGIGLPADPETQVVGEFGLGETVLDGGEKLGVTVGCDLDEDHGLNRSRVFLKLSLRFKKRKTPRAKSEIVTPDADAKPESRISTATI
jgi:hypothetical protein